MIVFTKNSFKSLNNPIRLISIEIKIFIHEQTYASNAEQTGSIPLHFISISQMVIIISCFFTRELWLYVIQLFL